MIKQLVSVLIAVFMWVLLLPGLLIRDRTGDLSPPWRPVLLVALGVVVLGVGCWLIWTAADRLVKERVSPFAAHPGPVLITDGIYGRVRNPMDLGHTLVALAPAIAVEVVAVWIVPLAAFLYYAVGRGPLENYYLREKFEERFDDYRAAVPSWTPRWF